MEEIRLSIPIFIKRQIFLEACFKCPVCGSIDLLDIHHIIPYRICHCHTYDNLIGICNSCHKKLKNREYEFIEFFKLKKLDIRNKNPIEFKDNFSLIENLEKFSESGIYDRILLSEAKVKFNNLKSRKSQLHLKGRILLAEANLAKHRGNTNRAYFLALKALNHFKTIDNLLGISKSLYIIAGIFFIREEFEKALMFYFEAEKVIDAISFQKKPAIELMINIWRDVGITYMTIGSSTEGLKFNDKSLSKASSVSNQYLYNLSLMDKAKILTNLKKTDSAFPYLDSVAKEITNFPLVSNIMLLNYLSNLYIKDGDRNRAYHFVILAQRYSKIFGLQYENLTVTRNKKNIEC